jgi:hypothetical protein
VAVDLFQLEVRQNLRKIPKIDEWRKFFNELGRTLIPLSSKKTALDLPNLIIDAAVAGKRWDGIHEFSYPFIHACTVDGFDFGLLKALDNHQLTPDRAKLQLQNLIDYRPEARGQLEKILRLVPY